MIQLIINNEPLYLNEDKIAYMQIEGTTVFIYFSGLDDDHIGIYMQDKQKALELMKVILMHVQL